MSYEPKIIAFCCNWCSYAGADLAGVSRYQYPANIRIIRVMCSGRVDPVLALDALMLGMDGVIVTGCHLGDCHYITGNYETKRRFEFLIQALQKYGLEFQRIGLEWISAAEGHRFAQTMLEFTERVRKLGPISQQHMSKLKILRNAFDSERLRIVLNAARKAIEVEGTNPERYWQELWKILEEEFIRCAILDALRQKPLSVHEISSITGYNPKTILKQIISMVRRGSIRCVAVVNSTPIYGR